MTTDIASVLERAADLIEPEGAWIGGPGSSAWAQDSDGRSVDPRSPDACSFCLYAALEVASGGDLDSDIAAGRFLKTVVGQGLLAMWNHEAGRTQAEVVAKLREAAAKAREQGQ